MKGLDGIQGPIYVGTGCVFRRYALYGYDAPAKKKPPSRTCNCWPKWCCLCCGSRKSKKGKSKKEKKKKSKHRETSKQIHALENIEEGIEGKDCKCLSHSCVIYIVVLKRKSWANRSFLAVSETNNDKPSSMTPLKLEKKFGQSPVFVNSTLMENGGVPPSDGPASLLKEAIQVISCGYEDKTEWGKEVSIGSF